MSQDAFMFLNALLLLLVALLNFLQRSKPKDKAIQDLEDRCANLERRLDKQTKATANE